MNPKELRIYKLKIQCNRCNKYTNFASDHNGDGSIKNGLPSNDAPPDDHNNNANGSPVLKFGVATPSSSISQPVSSSFIASSFSAQDSSSVSLGSVVDGGAPYSTIGVTELHVLRSSLGLSRITVSDPMPESFAHFKFW